MKMPRRRFFPLFPPVAPRPDIFGLHQLSLLGQAGESAADREKRFATIEAGVRGAFKAAVGHLGEDEARRLFVRVLRRPKRGRGKGLALDRNYRLLSAFDTAGQNGESIPALARRLRAGAGGIELGNTADAIEAQIRKLLKERKEREHAAAVQTRLWRMATRHEPPSLLSVAMSKK
jgi:hypothetical protein